KVKKMVVLSTDKAAYPINAMGISKAMMEKVAIAESRNVDEKETTICVTRYGNVMASRGSVIPLFIEQIEEGKPLTLTDPDMTRFLMSLEESVDLVLFAYKNGRQGDLFVQKAASSTIRDLAQAMVNLFKAKSKIQIIGTRHGEKKYETLLTREEMAFAEDLGDFFRVPADTRDLNYAKFFEKGEKQKKELTDYNSSNVKLLDVKGVEKKLLTLDYIKSEIKRLKK
ncbi:MAG TPA: polysaccharide biosynthesis protein, partial [Clostridiales bacterium]|nr:polysaccharide biosynthesis protein [Clostridiales bacterium]